MNTFKDLYWQTTYKRPLVDCYKEDRTNRTLLSIIKERGETEQYIAMLHPTYENAGKRLTRRFSSEYVRDNNIHSLD